MSVSGPTDFQGESDVPLSDTAAERLSGLLAGLDRLEPILSLPRYPELMTPGPALGHFRLRSRLGAGRFGVVLLADDLSLRRQVVVKVPQPTMLADTSLRERFVREARAAARLDHPGIVSVFEAAELDGLPYLAAGWINGPTLRAWRRQYPQPISPAVAVRFTLSVANAIHHAHERGVLHCDLTPANILLQPIAADTDQLSSFEPLVTDFGLARLLDDDPAATRTFQIAGTPLYMAPEQARGDRRNLTARSDVYALGVILYELLVGTPPFRGDTSAVILQVQTQLPDPPRKRISSIPHDLNAIVLKSLEKEPPDRYPSAAAFADDLKRFLSRKPVIARPVSLPVRIARSAASHPLEAAIATCAFCVTALAIGVATDRWAKEVQARADLKVQNAQNKLAGATIQATLERAKAAEFYVILERVTQRRLSQSPGWSAANRVDLMRLCHEHLADSNSAIRSEIAAVAAGIELTAPRRIASGFHGHDVAYDPSGELIAVSGHTRNDSGMVVVRIYEVSTGKLNRVLEVPADLEWEARTDDRRDGCWIARFNLSGSEVVAGTRSGWIVLWDLTAADGKPRSRWRHVPLGTSEDWRRTPITRFVFDQNGRLWSSDDVTVAVWDPNSPETALERQIGYVSRTAADRAAAPARVLSDMAALHPNQDWFVKREQGHYLFVQLNDDQTLGRLAISSDDRAEDNTITDLLISPNGVLLATAATHANHLKLWDLISDRLLSNRLMPPGSLKLSFRPDGRELAVIDDGGVQIFSTPQATVCDALAIGPYPLEDASMSSDGSVLATLATVPNRDVIHVNVHDLQHPHSLHPIVSRQYASPWHNSRRRLGISPNGQRIVVHSCDQLERWQPHDHRRDRIGELRGTRSIQFDPAGQLWAIGERTVVTWRDQENVVVNLEESVASMAVSVDYTLVGLVNGVVTRVSPNGEVIGRIKVSDSSITALAREGDRMIAGAGNGDLHIFAADQEVQRISSAHHDTIWAAAIGPHGQFATGAADRTVRIWDRDGSPTVTLYQTRPVRRLFWRRDDQSLWILAEGERALRRWHLDALETEYASYGLSR